MKKIFAILKRKLFLSKKSISRSSCFGLFSAIPLTVFLAVLGVSTGALGQIITGHIDQNAYNFYASVGSEVSGGGILNTKRVYENAEKITLSDDVFKIITEKISLESKDSGTSFDSLSIGLLFYTLLDYTNEWHANTPYLSLTGDPEVAEAAEALGISIDTAVRKGTMTLHEAEALRREAERIIKIGEERAREATKDSGQKYRMSNASDYALVMLYGICPTMKLTREKYTTSCWSCLVIERLTAAFMTAAEKGIEVSEKAGMVLLKIGALIWIALWGVRTVSSMTQIEPANVLNELFKFCFKVMLAYAFIQGGMSMVSKYFINPIMGAGAKIAYAYWEEDKIKSSVEEYTWGDENYEEIEKEEKAAFDAIEKGTYTVAEETSTITYDEAQQSLIASQKTIDANNLSQDIPTFLIPGTNVGRLTSPFGCRKRPKVGCVPGAYKDASGQCYGSAAHKGIDIGTQGKEGGVVFAIAGGTIAYNGGENSTAGYYASIQTKDKLGNTWTHRYLHMQPRSHTDFRFPNNQVASGQQIGYIGNTGIKGGAHLHLDIMFNGTWKGKKYNNAYVDPLRLSQGVFYTVNFANCKGEEASFPSGFAYHQSVPEKPWTAPGAAYLDLSSTYVQGSAVGDSFGTGSIIVKFPEVTYKGPTGLISKAVMNSILGATKAIGNITAENMILGDAVMCYSKQENGGAWKITVWGKNIATFTNVFLWLEGVFIWCTGLLLTIAFVFYLLDLAFKIGFAAMALPLTVGLWPFEITKDKVGICVSIIAKAAATFAFIAMTTTFIVHIHDAAFNYELTEADIEDAEKYGISGLARLYDVFDNARMGTISDDDLDYARRKLGFFEVTFVLLLFAFLYSYKLLQQTVPSLVDKFFPDKAFGSSSPMHHMATAAVKAGKDIAMKPIGWARDATLYSGRRGIIKGAKGIKNGVSWVAGKITGKGKEKDKDDKKEGEK